MLTTLEAIDVFVKSFSYTRSFTHPTEVVRRECLQIIRDLPRRSGERRRDEVMVPPGAKPDEVLPLVEKYEADMESRYMLCVFVSGEQEAAEVKAFYKRNQFRLLATEPLMVADLQSLSPEEKRHTVRCVGTWDEVNAIAKLSRNRLLTKAHLERNDSPARLYYIESDGKVAAYGRNVTPQKNASYVAGLFTEDAYRRQGMGSAILRQIFADDRERGVEYSILLASKVGTLLYTTTGYTHLGLLLMFSRKHRSVGTDS